MVIIMVKMILIMAMMIIQKYFYLSIGIGVLSSEAEVKHVNSPHCLKDVIVSINPVLIIIIICMIFIIVIHIVMMTIVMVTMMMIISNKAE